MQGKHHTSLCTTDPSKPPTSPPPALTLEPTAPSTQPTLPAQAASAPPTPSTPPPTQLNVTTPNNDVNSTKAALSTSSNTVTLLKTAIAMVGAQHTYCKANILFDEGAQR